MRMSGWISDVCSSALMAPMLDDAPWPPWGLVDSLSSGSGARLSLSDPGALSESWSAVTEVTGVGWLKPADWIRVPVTTISDWPDWSAAPVCSAAGSTTAGLGVSWADRKLVVTGRGVSVRVEIGGSRIIQKKYRE